MTATEVEVQVGTAPLVDVDVQVEPPTFTVISVLPTGPRGPAGPPGAGGSAIVESVVAGTNVTVDATDPANPIVSSTGGGGGAPDPHAASHADGGSDEVSLDGSQITTGTVADARIAASIARDSEVTAAVAAEATLARNADNLTSGTVADARIASTLARDSEVTSAVAAEAVARDAAIATHAGLADPHPGYLTPAEGNAAYDAAGAAATVDSALTAHISDAADAHDASAVSFVPNGSIAATDVQAAIQEVRDEAGSGSLTDAVILAPTTATRNQIAPTVAAALGLEVVGRDDQGGPLFILTSDTPPGSEDIFQVRQSVALGGSDIFTIDDSGQVDISVWDGDANGLTIQNEGGTPATAALLQIIGSMAARTEIAAFQVSGLAGGATASTFFDGGMRIELGGTGAVLVFDPVTGTTTVQAHVGQTVPLLELKDENGVTVAEVLPSGAIGTAANAAPADGDIANGEVFWWLDDTAAAPVINFKGKDSAGTVFTRTYEVAGNLAAHIADTSDAHDASAISILDTANDFTATDVEGALAELQTDHEADATALSDHIADSLAAHAASAVSFTPNGSIAATDVQAAIQEVRDEAVGGLGAPTTADYLVGTANALLSSEIVVGTSPGGELGGSWASPTVDATHSGSSHAAVQAAAEATAASALAAHVDDTSDAHDASVISILDTANDFTATDVEGALAELQTADEADEAALANHLSDASDAHDASAISILDTAGDFTATDVEGALAELQTFDEATTVDLGALQTQTAVQAAQLAAHLAAELGFYVGQGLVYTPNATPTKLDSTAGTGLIGTVEILPAVQTAIATTIASLADATNPKWVAVEIDTAGATQFNQGTAAAAPALPTFTASRIPVYLIYVPANATNVDTLLTTNNGLAKLIDIRIIKPGPSPTGWQYDQNTWVYASANTYTIAGIDATGYLRKGAKISYNDGAVDYGYVASVTFSTNTTVTVIPTTDYSIANATLVRPRFSYVESPQGFPTWLEWAPGLLGWGPNPSNGALITTVASVVATSTFTKVAHGLTDGTPISFSGLTLTTGVNNNITTYFVVNAAADTFQASATKGGTAITLGGTADATITVSKIGLYRYCCNGTQITVAIRQTTVGTSIAAAHTITLPVAAATITNMVWAVVSTMTDNGNNVAGQVRLSSAGTVVNADGLLATSNNTASGSSRVNTAILIYEF